MAKQKKPVTTEKAVRSAPPAPVQEQAGLFITKVSNTKIMVFILLATAVCLVPVLQNDFLAFDDPSYVTDNPLIQHLGLGNIKAFFTRQFVSTYQPLVMLSYAIEFKLFGMSGPGFHFFSLLVHLANVALVYLLAERLVKNRIAAVVTALLFGIHPLHVESVAWVASQKDVLYACFFLASSLCYLRFVSDNNKKYYALAIVLFMLSLLSKAQAVVLPVVFLLFDYLQGRKIDGKAVVEKVPFFALSLIFGIVAFTMQTKTGAVQDFA